MCKMCEADAASHCLRCVAEAEVHARRLGQLDTIEARVTAISERATAQGPPDACRPDNMTAQARIHELEGVGDGTVERCGKPKGHDDDHALLMELERGAVEAACAVMIEGPITADEARVRSANRFLIKREAELVAEIPMLEKILAKRASLASKEKS